MQPCSRSMPRNSKMSWPGLRVGAEHLFVVVQAVAALARQEQGGYGRQVEIAVVLLENRAEIDNRIDIGVRRGEAADWRARRGGKEGAEIMKAG